MDFAAQWYLDRLSRQAQSAMDMVAQRVRVARQPIDIKRAVMSIHVDAIVRHDPLVMRAKREALSSAEKKLKKMSIDFLVEAKEKYAAPDPRRAQDYFQAMRGDFPSLYIWFQRELAKVKMV